MRAALGESKVIKLVFELGLYWPALDSWDCLLNLKQNIHSFTPWQPPLQLYSELKHESISCPYRASARKLLGHLALGFDCCNAAHRIWKSCLATQVENSWRVPSQTALAKSTRSVLLWSLIWAKHDHTQSAGTAQQLSLTWRSTGDRTKHFSLRKAYFKINHNQEGPTANAPLISFQGDREYSFTNPKCPNKFQF